MSRIFGQLRQCAYVVRSVDEAMEHWTQVMGVGPFFVADCFHIDDFRYRDLHAPIDMKVALANCGSIQIELIELVSDTPSNFRDFLVAHGEGQHHIAFWPESFDQELAELLSRGYRVLQSGTTVDGDPFVYLDTEQRHPGTVIELTEVKGLKGRVFESISRAAAGWDGSEPTRSLEDLITASLVS
jgi:4-hydroxyphenylpyruvate dioxygenase-like putative hemolysin